MPMPITAALNTYDFRRITAFGTTLAALSFILPFTVYNFAQGHITLAGSALLILVVLTINAWNIRQGRYRPNLTLFGLTPAIIFFISISLREQGFISVMWCYPAVNSFYFMLPERKAWIANAMFLVMVLPQVWLLTGPELATRAIATLLLVNVFSILYIRLIANLQTRLHDRAMTDPLTGLLNRTLLDETLQRTSHESARTGTPMTLLALDLDHFKHVNDQWGHDAGDHVLQGVGELLRKRARVTDQLFRPGGEEFLVLLFDTDSENGLRVAEEIRCTIEAHQFLDDHPVTVSIGVATLEPGEGAVPWLKRADRNLYRAKDNGRNRVVASEQVVVSRPWNLPR